MADDIDIEEHDVLDHPQLRNIFPDISRIKEEVIDPEEEQDEFPFEASEQYVHQPLHISAAFSYDETEEYPRHNNKIILGSKPSPLASPSLAKSGQSCNSATGESFKIKEEPPDVEESMDIGQTFEETEASSILRNTLLGSRPSSIQKPIIIGSKSSPTPTSLIVGNTAEPRSLILGSKPTNSKSLVLSPKPVERKDSADESDSDTQDYVLKESSVVLENWGPRLERSKCYCKECEILFPTRNILDAHKMTAHSFLIALDTNKAVKSTSKDFRGPTDGPSNSSNSNKPGGSKFCNHCNKTFSNDTALITHLYDILTAGNSQGKTPVPKAVVKNEPSKTDSEEQMFLRCQVCGVFFKSLLRCNKHVNLAHGTKLASTKRTPFVGNCWFCFSQLSSREIFNKHMLRVHNDIFYNKRGDTIPNSSANTAGTPNKSLKPALMPKSSKEQTITSISYQCIKCSRKFLTYSAARYHRALKHPELANNTTIKKIISKKNDPSCGTNSQSFKPKYGHDDQPLKCNTQSSLKRKLEDSDVTDTTAKKIKSSKGELIFYCIHCQCNMVAKYVKSEHYTIHLNGECKNVFKRKSTVCKVCGIMVGSHRHLEYHHKNPGIKLSDFQFVRLQDNVSIPPPIPNYPYCRKCGVRVIKAKVLRNHECDDNYKTCGICKKKFSDLAYKLHVGLHKTNSAKKSFDFKATELAGFELSKASLKTPRNSVDLPEIPTPKKVTPQKSAVGNLPVLLQKYEKLAETWSVLYLCKTCDIIHDTYDAAVEHCQNHFNNMESYDITIKHCQNCDLKFEGKCFEKHKSLHARNASITKDTFQILAYNYEDLFSPKWMNIFAPLPVQQSEHIVNQSLYKYCRNFKMTVIEHGSPYYTIFVCGKCGICSPNVDYARHLNCDKGNKSCKCRVCHNPFTSFQARDSHEAMHDLTNNFRKVLFNAPEDEEFNKALIVQNNSVAIKSEKVENEDADINQEHKPFHFYRCSKCQSCVLSADSVNRHICRANIKECKICGYMFCGTALARHLVMHATHPSLSQKTVKITDFNPNFDLAKSPVSVVKIPERPTVKIFRCGCGLHFTSLKTVEKHHDICGTENVLTEENCSKCGLLFDTHELFAHLCKHHSNSDSVKFDIEEVAQSDDEESDLDISKPIPKSPTNTKSIRDQDPMLYKCKKCDIHYLRLRSMRNHYKMKHRYQAPAKKCKVCGLKFSAFTLPRHKVMHHQKNKFKSKHFQITIYEPDQNGRMKVCGKWNTKHKFSENASESQKKKDMKLNSYSRTLYLCKKCQVHFLVPRTATRHQNLCHKIPTCVCEICGLSFSKRIIMRHKYIHHDRMKLQRKHFKIQTLDDTTEVVEEEEDEPEVTTQKLKSKGKIIKGPLMSNMNVSPKMKVLNPDKYSKVLYQCEICEANFMSHYSWKSHRNRVLKCSEGGTKYKCRLCNYQFLCRSIKTHMYIHHKKMKLKREDFEIFRSENPATEFDSKASQERNVSKNKLRENMDSLSESEKSVSDVQKTSEPDDDDLESKMPEVKDGPFLACVNFPAYIKKMDLASYTDTLYQCGICEANFLSIRSLRSHKVRHKEMDPKYKCRVCRFIFMPLTLIKHMFVHHQKMKLGRKDLKIVKDQQYTTESEDEISETESTTTTNKQIEYVNKYSNKIYKCSKCGGHFLSPRKLGEHYAKCGTVRHDLRTCDVCDLVFSATALSAHIFIHHTELKLETKDIQIVECGKNVAVIRSQIFDENISKCGYCGLCFLKHDGVATHIARQGKSHRTSINTVECDICGLTFSKVALEKHKDAHHIKLGLKLSDFVINVAPNHILNEPFKSRIVFEDSNTMDSDITKKKGRVSRPSDADTNFTDNQPIDETNKPESATVCSNVLFKCSLCSAHFLSDRSVDRHFLRRDWDLLTHTYQSTECDICGLKLTNLDLHKKLHHEQLNLSREDIEIITFDIYNGSYFGHNNLYRCHICKAHFHRIWYLAKHIENCGPNNRSNLVKCYKCSFAFLKPISKHIINFHKSGIGKKDIKVYQIIDGKLVAVNVDETDDGETSNVDTLLSFDESSILAEETQDFDDERSTRDGKTTDDEMSLNLNVERTYYEKTDEELSTVDVLTVDDKSISGDDDNVPLQNLKSSIDLNKYDNTIYECVKCEIHFIKKDSARLHLSRSECKKTIRIPCSQCGLLFSDRIMPRHIYIHHEFHQLKREDFRIVIYGSDKTNTKEESKTQISKMRRMTLDNDSPLIEKMATKRESMFTLSEKILNAIDLSHYDNKVYRCKKCTNNFLTFSTLKAHDHSKQNKSKCPECGLEFTYQSVCKHMYIHHENMKLKREDIEVCDERGVQIMETRELDSESNKTKSNRDNYDVDHSDSIDTSDLLETSSVSTNLSLEECIKRRPRRSDTNLSLNSEMKTSTDISIDSYHNKVYECVRCSACYIDIKSSRKHMMKCTGHVRKQECEICFLPFPLKSIWKHRVIHHNKMNLSRNEIVVVKFNQNSAANEEQSEVNEEVPKADTDLSTLDQSLYNNELYKCKDCNMHFIGKPDFDDHFKTKEHKIPRYNCTICKLPFSLRALPIHIFIHHEEMKLAAEHFLILTGTKEESTQEISTKAKETVFKLYTNKNEKPSTDTSNQFDSNDKGLSLHSNEIAESESVKSAIDTEDKAENSKSTAESRILRLYTNKKNESVEKTKKSQKDNLETETDTDSLVQSSSDLQTSMEDKKKKENKSKTTIKLYKCGECNVYFITQSSCYKHMVKHKPLDTLEYIECKICGFQFRIVSLHKHMLNHHSKGFKWEDVLVEEYLPSENGTPTLDIYFAKDKLQSKMVSTTSEKVDSKVHDGNNGENTNDIAKRKSNNVADKVISENKKGTDSRRSSLDENSKNSILTANVTEGLTTTTTNLKDVLPMCGNPTDVASAKDGTCEKNSLTDNLIDKSNEKLSIQSNIEISSKDLEQTVSDSAERNIEEQPNQIVKQKNVDVPNQVTQNITVRDLPVNNPRNDIITDEESVGVDNSEIKETVIDNDSSNDAKIANNIITADAQIDTEDVILIDDDVTEITDSNKVKDPKIAYIDDLVREIKQENSENAFDEAIINEAVRLESSNVNFDDNVIVNNYSDSSKSQGEKNVTEEVIGDDKTNISSDISNEIKCLMTPQPLLMEMSEVIHVTDDEDDISLVQNIKVDSDVTTQNISTEISHDNVIEIE